MIDWLIAAGIGAFVLVCVTLVARRGWRQHREFQEVIGRIHNRGPMKRIELGSRASLMIPFDIPWPAEERIEELRQAVAKAFTGPPHSEIVLLEEGLELEVSGNG